MDNEKEAILIDTRTYPVRNPEEPDTERITRGSRDGFVETMIFNIALVRRRIRDPGLRVEGFRLGRRSKTDVAIMYIRDIASDKLVDEVRDRLQGVDIDGLPMAEKSVEEFIAESNWNIFPLVRYTERPDVAAVHLYEGHVLVLVDTSPAVMILPATFFIICGMPKNTGKMFLPVFIFAGPLSGRFYFRVSGAAVFWFRSSGAAPKRWSFIGPKK